MVRKSKQASGNATLTHYELRHKLTKDHGTLERRLAGHAQYQLGECGLSLTPLWMTGNGKNNNTILCSPSGYLYQDDAILQYLIIQTQQLKKQEEEEEEQQQQVAAAAVDNDKNGSEIGKRKAAFESAHRDWAKQKKSKSDSSSLSASLPLADSATAKIVDTNAAKQDLKRTSYWLAEAQPVAVATAAAAKSLPNSTGRRRRPLSPHSQQPLRRKDLWPVQLDYQDNDDANDNTATAAAAAAAKKMIVSCALTGKPIRTQAAVAYWVNKDEPGRVVLQEEGFNQLIKSVGDPKKKKKNERNGDDEPICFVCPRTNQKIKYTRLLQRSGSSFATSGQTTVVKQYRPTLT